MLLLHHKTVRSVFADAYVISFNLLKGRGVNWLHFAIQV